MNKNYSDGSHRKIAPIMNQIVLMSHVLVLALGFTGTITLKLNITTRPPPQQEISCTPLD